MACELGGPQQNLQVGQALTSVAPSCIQVDVQGQSSSPLFTLKAQVTNSDLEFEPASIDFGDCNMGEYTAAALSILNR
jgi:hypothetical protein